MDTRITEIQKEKKTNWQIFGEKMEKNGKTTVRQLQLRFGKAKKGGKFKKLKKKIEKSGKNGGKTRKIQIF